MFFEINIPCMYNLTLIGGHCNTGKTRRIIEIINNLTPEDYFVFYDKDGCSKLRNSFYQPRLDLNGLIIYPPDILDISKLENFRRPDCKKAILCIDTYNKESFSHEFLKQFDEIYLSVQLNRSFLNKNTPEEVKISETDLRNFGVVIVNGVVEKDRDRSVDGYGGRFTTDGGIIVSAQTTDGHLRVYES